MAGYQFTEQEWELLLAAPSAVTSAMMLADRSGMIGMAKEMLAGYQAAGKALQDVEAGTLLAALRAEMERRARAAAGESEQGAATSAPGQVETPGAVYESGGAVAEGAISSMESAVEKSWDVTSAEAAEEAEELERTVGSAGGAGATAGDETPATGIMPAGAQDKVQDMESAVEKAWDRTSAEAVEEAEELERTVGRAGGAGATAGGDRHLYGSRAMDDASAEQAQSLGERAAELAHSMRESVEETVERTKEATAGAAAEARAAVEQAKDDVSQFPGTTISAGSGQVTPAAPDLSLRPEEARDPVAMKAKALQTIAAAEALLAVKATPADAAAYKAWLYQVARDVASASKEGGFLGFGGKRIGEGEQALLDELRAALGVEA